MTPRRHRLTTAELRALATIARGSPAVPLPDDRRYGRLVWMGLATPREGRLAVTRSGANVLLGSGLIHRKAGSFPTGIECF